MPGRAPSQIRWQRVGHPAQQVVDERSPGDVPSVLPAGTRWTVVADNGIQRLGVNAPRCHPGAHQQSDVIGTVEAQQRRTISVKYADR